MQKLAKREEQIMQALWDLEKGFVKEIVELLPDPKPHYNSVSTMVRILVDKGFVAYEAFGKTHRYYPLASRSAPEHNSTLARVQSCSHTESRCIHDQELFPRHPAPPLQ